MLQLLLKLTVCSNPDTRDDNIQCDETRETVCDKLRGVWGQYTADSVGSPHLHLYCAAWCYTLQCGDEYREHSRGDQPRTSPPTGTVLLQYCYIQAVLITLHYTLYTIHSYNIHYTIRFNSNTGILSFSDQGRLSFLIYRSQIYIILVQLKSIRNIKCACYTKRPLSSIRSSVPGCLTPATRTK